MTTFFRRSVAQDHHVGDTLRRLREEHHMTIDGLAQKTHIQKKYLSALESSAYHLLPGDIYTKNFLKTIAQFYKINETLLLDAYEREAASFPFHTTYTPPSSIQTPRFWTPRKLRTIAIACVLCLAIGYVVFEFSGLFAAPELQIFSPADNIEVQDLVVHIEGETQPGSVVTINTVRIDVDDTGHFAADIDIPPGVNVLQITSTNKFGRTATQSRNLFAKP